MNIIQYALTTRSEIFFNHNLTPYVASSMISLRDRKIETSCILFFICSIDFFSLNMYNSKKFDFFQKILISHYLNHMDGLKM